MSLFSFGASGGIFDWVSIDDVSRGVSAFTISIPWLSCGFSACVGWLTVGVVVLWKPWYV